MKKRILLFTALAGMGYVFFSSYAAGPANGSGPDHFDCTGAGTDHGNVLGCQNGACHGPSATTGITLTVELDSTGGVPTTHYKNGKTYTIKITGTNTTSNNLPKFGFQACVIKGTTSSATPVNAGSLQSTGLPAGISKRLPISGQYIDTIMEHNTALSPTSGTGGTGTVYSVSFTWVAPAAGTGDVSIWAALNAVNNDAGASNADKWNTNHVTISEWPGYLSVSETYNSNSVKAYPNPVVNNLNIQLENGQAGDYSLQVFDLNGRLIANENISINAAQPASINTSNWPQGMYMVVMEKDDNRQVTAVFKQ